MSSFTCHCGYTWDITRIPEPGLWVAYSAAVEEAVAKREAESLRLDHVTEPDAIRLRANDAFVANQRTQIYECRACGSLTWYREKNGEPELFVPKPRDT